MAQMYELDVPLTKSGTEGGDSRYGCCHRTEALGHADTCTQEVRTKYIEEALARTGIVFKRCTDEDKQPGDEERRGSPELEERPPMPVGMLPAVEQPMRDAEELAAQATVRITSIETLPAPLESGRMSSAEPNLGNGPKGRDLMELGGEVHHPKHYNEHPAGIECVDVNEHMTANIAAAVKYVWRAGLKPDSAHDRDLASAVWYIERERKRVKSAPKHTAAFGGGER